LFPVQLDHNGIGCIPYLFVFNVALEQIYGPQIQTSGLGVEQGHHPILCVPYAASGQCRNSIDHPGLLHDRLDRAHLR
jgi:hypothetical protein